MIRSNITLRHNKKGRQGQHAMVIQHSLQEISFKSDEESEDRSSDLESRIIGTTIIGIVLN